jgi:aspartate/methionine/tyrosine aminotransferase
MYAFEAKNRHFDRLTATPGLRWMGQNTNHLPLHPAVLAAMREAIASDEIRAYAPPAGIEALRRGILADLGLEDLSVVVTDGAIEALYHICRTFLRPGDRLVTTDPSWKWPLAFARDAGAEVVEIPIYGDEHGWRLSPGRLEAAVAGGARMIYLVDPNNPLGIAYTQEEIEAFAAIARRAGAYLVHDCTYRHFADSHTLAARFLPESTFTSYSFSKWLGLAGLRVGAVVAHPALLETYAAAPPNNLGCNVLSQRAAIAGLEVKDAWFPEVQRVQRRNQQAVRDAFEALPGFRLPVFPSQGNFLVVECEGVRPEALAEVALEDGFLIRHGSYHTERFGHRFVKISTTVPAEWADAFCGRLPAMVERARGRNRVGDIY